MTTIASAPPVTVQTPTAQPAPAATKPQATASAASSNAIFKTPAELVEVGEKFLDNLASHLGAADGFRNSLKPDNMAELRGKYGDEFAGTLRSMFEDGMHRAEAMAGTDVAALRSAFSISGDLIKQDEAGYRRLGKFTLSGQGPGFAVQIDSEKGASVSTGGGPFTSDFARITPPQLRNLPYLKVIADTLNVKV